MSCGDDWREAPLYTALVVARLIGYPHEHLFIDFHPFCDAMEIYDMTTQDCYHLASEIEGKCNYIEEHSDEINVFDND